MSRTRSTTLHRLLVGISIILTSCSFSHAYSHYPGLTYVSPLGSPPARSLLWSPKDSSLMLVNSSEFTSGHAEVRLINLSRQESILLKGVEFGSIAGTSWSRDGRFVAMAISGAAKDSPAPGIWKLNIDDGSMIRITDRYGNGLLLGQGNAIAWMGPDGTGASRRPAIYLEDMQSTTSKAVFFGENGTTFYGASLSPDGEMLAFSIGTPAGDSVDIYVLQLSTGEVRQLTRNGHSSLPAWSPTGNVIAYQEKLTNGDEARRQLRLISVDARCDVKIKEFSEATSPTWSPDGKRLAFIGPDGIYVIDLLKTLGRDISNGLCRGR